MPIVSIIVPVYNTEQYVAEALESLLNQTYKDIEIICINDGSTDNSLKIIEDFAKKDNRIKVFSQENKGLPATKNVGISLANGKYLNFVDSDDTISSNTIETSVKIAEETNCDIVVNYLNLTNSYIDKSTKDRPWMSAPQPFMKKEVFEKYGVYYDEDLTTGEDIIFSHKLLALTDKVELNPSSYYFYRVREGQMTTHNFDSKFPYYINQWLDKFTIFYNKNNLWKEKNKHILSFFATVLIPNYASRNLSFSDRVQIYDSVKKFIENHSLRMNFPIENKTDILLKLFLLCKKAWLFEFVRIVANFYIKTVSLLKKYKRKHAK